MDQRTLAPLSYSDGEQSPRRPITTGPDAGRRGPTLPPPGYDKRQQFIAWADDERLPPGRAAGRPRRGTATTT